jgi:hypothetical protein
LSIVRAASGSNVAAFPVRRAFRGRSTKVCVSNDGNSLILLPIDKVIGELN